MRTPATLAIVVVAACGSRPGSADGGAGDGARPTAASTPRRSIR
jgi:hypothetical protein